MTRNTRGDNFRDSLLQLLREHGGLHDPFGRVTGLLAKHYDLAPSYTAIIIRELEDKGDIVREVRGKRTFTISLPGREDNKLVYELLHYKTALLRELGPSQRILFSVVRHGPVRAESTRVLYDNLAEWLGLERKAISGYIGTLVKDGWLVRTVEGNVLARSVDEFGEAKEAPTRFGSLSSPAPVQTELPVESTPVEEDWRGTENSEISIESEPESDLTGLAEALLNRVVEVLAAPQISAAPVVAKLDDALAELARTKEILAEYRSGNLKLRSANSDLANEVAEKDATIAKLNERIVALNRRIDHNKTRQTVTSRRDGVAVTTIREALDDKTRAEFDRMIRSVPKSR